ncbi:MAG: trypsin-like peptidase domain-containing protein, partial [Anaerolineae bacterium]|nr:trypsin-like peptidase domain-containing protein [Anaerolineae bacterium]
MKPIESAIVRIFAQNKTSIVGVGFLIDGKRVMTCAHVVAKAFGIARDTSIQDLPAERITLDFPLVDDNHPCTASVVLWLPPMPDETGDIAVLEFDQQRPFSTAPVKLVGPSKYWDKPFGTYGYPQSIGGWASGVVRGRIAGNRLQIINKDEKSYFIQPGFSGSPVYCDEAGVQGVIGMVASGETDPNLD